MASPEAPATSLAAAGRATLILTGGAVLVQFIGFARQLFLAAEVGITSRLDALLIALAAPETLAAVLSAGVATAIVPAYAAARDELGVFAARRLAGTVLVWVGLAGLAVAVSLWVFADFVVAVTAPGLTASGTEDEAAGYLRLLAPLAPIVAISAVLHATCQAERLFPSMTIATVAGPFLTLAVLVYFWDSLALDGLAIGTLVGAMLGLVILAGATIIHRVPPRPYLVSRGLGLRGLVRHATPLTLSSLILQVSQIIDRLVATLVLPGGVGALRYGNSVVRLPFGAIRPAYRTAIYPTLVDTARDRSGSGLGEMTERVLRYGVVFFVPLAGLMIATAPVATMLLYDRGSFSEEDLWLTAGVVAVSAPLIVSWTALPAIVSALNARRKGTILLAGGLVTTVTNLVLTAVFAYAFGIIGVAAATTVASSATMLFMGVQLRRIEPSLSLAAIWRTLLKASCAISPTVLLFGVPIWSGLIIRDAGMQLIIMVIAGVAGLTSYYRIARRLGLDEADAITSFATSTLRRTYRRLRS